VQLELGIKKEQQKQQQQKNKQKLKRTNSSSWPAYNGHSLESIIQGCPSWLEVK